VAVMAAATMVTAHQFKGGPGKHFFWPPARMPPPDMSAPAVGLSTVRVSVLLANETSIEGLLPTMNRAGSGVLRGFLEAERRGLLPDGAFFNVTFCDSRCHASYGPKCFTDSIIDGVDVFFGPSCDYSLGELLFRMKDLFSRKPSPFES